MADNSGLLLSRRELFSKSKLLIVYDSILGFDIMETIDFAFEGYWQVDFFLYFASS